MKTYIVEVLAKPSYLRLTKAYHAIQAKMDWPSEVAEVLEFSDENKPDPKLTNVNYFPCGRGRIYAATYDGEALVLQINEVKNP